MPNSRFHSSNEIHPSAYIGPNVKMGKNNTIAPGVVIGAKGHIRNSDKHDGTVVIGHGNSIGANTTIHSGEMGPTLIGNHNIIMAQVNIGHNCIIQNNVEICAGVTLAGWVLVGHRVKIKIGTVVITHIHLADDSFIAAGATVVKDTLPGMSYFGTPAKERPKIDETSAPC